MSLKILIFGVQPHSPHFETQLELTENHLSAGDEVSYLSCDACLSHCNANPENDQLFCRGCIGKRHNGLALLSRPCRVENLSGWMRGFDPSSVQTRFASLEELLAYRFGEYDCGEAVASSLLSFARTVYPDMRAYADYIQRAVVSSAQLYFAARARLRAERPDLVYFFNGRSASGRCFLRACQLEGVRFFTHERGSTINSYLLAENTVPHDVDYRQQEIRRHWDANPDLAAKTAVAEKFYARMRRGQLAYREANYLKHQVADQVPESWRKRSPRLVFFSSTETERAALGNFYSRRIYTSLIDALTRIVSDLAAREFAGILAIRMHPNSAEEYAHLSDRLSTLAGHDFVTLIPPTASVDTYALLDSADKVLVMTSTLGMEAAYSGKPTISLERSNYDKLGSVHAPLTHAEVMRCLLEPLPPLDRLGALMYGYYTLTFGTPFTHVSMRGQNKTSFNGRKVRAPRHIDWLIKLRGRLQRA